MGNAGRRYVEHRTIGRRKDDRHLRDHIRKHNQLFQVGQTITSEINMDVLFEVIMDQTNQIMGTERSSVLRYDDGCNELWSLVSTDMKKNEIRMPADYGVAGWVFQNKTPLVINDAYGDPRFYSKIDKKSGFRTRNILCIPLINRQRECIGALEALNKKAGDFTDEDRDLLTSISHYVAIALENARLYEELKVLDKAKERIINHLSHELKTPLAIISAVLERVSKELQGANIESMEKTIKRGQRNLNRLLELQAKIDDILNQRDVEEKETIISLIEDAAGFLEEISEENHQQNREILELISKRIESLYSVDQISMEKIVLPDFLRSICAEAVASMGQRGVNILGNFEKEIVLMMDKMVLKKVCIGLLKNAIENTPDEGRIEINARSENDSAVIQIRDYGVGITPLNQKMIFGGFFHTQDTDCYSSKRPYDFNAGGSGSDLLRAKAFSERFGFPLDFNSTRCIYIPNDTDMCPGKISACPFIAEESECFSSGGSTFSIKLPLKAATREPYSGGA